MTSQNAFTIEASLRKDVGKGASRRLRREEKVPAVVYGGKGEATALTIEHKEILKSLKSEAFYSHILTLKIDSKPEKVILKDLQRHAYKPRILHVDFQRVRADEKINMNVPLHFIGDDVAPGVTEEEGVISHVMNDVEIACLPADLPEFIEVDVSAMKLHDVIHLSDLKLAKGVEIIALTHDDDKPVVSIHLPRPEEEEPEEEITEEEEEESKASEEAEGDTEAEETGDADKKESDSEEKK